MGGSLFSPRWFRVAALKPQLRQQIELRRQVQRGVVWHLLTDPTGQDVRRVNRAAFEFIGRCDGSTTVQAIWDDLLQAAPDDAMTQDDVVRLLIALHERGVLEFDVSPDVETLFRARAAKRRQRRHQALNPFAFRLALVDPSRLLDRLAPLARPMFGRAAFAAWLVLMAWAAVAVATNWGEIAAQGRQFVESPRHALLAWLVYPVVKLLHELGHALAVRRWGGHVLQAGISLLMLSPVPFVNASAADGFRHAHQRAVVSAAGIVVELALAALALAVWLAVEPGWVRDVALTTMVVGGVSTVLVNANPLMRFDGYYLLCDLLDLRNLSARSTRLWRELLGRALLGQRPPLPLQALPGERPWLIAYVPLATAYRIALSVWIAVWLGHLSTVLGALVGVFVLGVTVLRPARAAWRAVREAGAGAALWRGALAAALLAAALAAVPVPLGTLAQGVVWPPEQAQLRAASDGVVLGYEVADGAPVHTGMLLARLADERLQAEQATLAADAAAFEIALYRALETDPDQVPALRAKLEFSRAEAAREAERAALLALHAQVDGRLVVPHQADQPGQYRQRGDLLGYVLTGEPATVRVALPQDEAALVRERSGRIGVRLAGEELRVRPGVLVRDMSAAVARLPSAALGDAGGGAIAVDPADQAGQTPLSPVVLLDVQVPDLQAERIGARALVRFDHGTEPLAARLLRSARQLVLRQFNPAA